ncbi:hypothetical protein VNO77_33112 [Canavalia gladiata]|uniref:non-specific serine/threonine protein kinase n=1 Tax=Canavalia gladiata TaxID=3824 RepID=A0AAN9PXF4_CANGL
MSKSLYFLFALSIILMTCYADNSNKSATCAPSNCGKVSIGYPFWRRSNTMVGVVCGYPDFGLECSEGHAIITLPSDTYYVEEINYDQHSITLVDIDILNQACPRAQHNVSLHNLPLSFSSLDLNLNFYFNCSSYPSSVDPIGCFLKNSHDTNQSYVFSTGMDYGYDEWLMQCEEHVVVTVLQDEIESGDLITGFGAAMKKGFVLDWRRAEDCAECEQSGGYCGFNQTTKQSRCICRDGRTFAKSCNKGTLALAC